MQLSKDPLEQAMQALSLDQKWFSPVEAEDPFNDDLALKGFISRRPDHRYGALYLSHVGGEPVPQVIFATPKLHYPFDRTGAFRFPPIREIHIYEKLDGTNVLAYRYVDAEGNIRTTYKLRLFPVLRNGKFGAFLDMWKEMLSQYPQIADLPTLNGCSISFELYGAQNAHLILYENALACALLFGVSTDGAALHPESLETRGAPLARKWGVLTAQSDPVREYARIRAEMEAQNKPLEDDKLAGVEGSVWYVFDKDSALHLFKCKPESVEAVHWVTGINKQAVMATCWNLLETQDQVTYELLYPLLAEEYTEEEIDKFRPHIDDCIMSIQAQLLFQEQVLDAYRAIGISVHEDKAACMRQMAQKFPKSMMKKVYSVLIRAV